MELIIPISLSSEKYLRYYQGSIKQVFAKSEQGKSVSFPANVLKPYVTHQGIHGRFKFIFDDNGKIISVTPLT